MSRTYTAVVFFGFCVKSEKLEALSPDDDWEDWFRAQGVDVVHLMRGYTGVGYHVHTVDDDAATPCGAVDQPAVFAGERAVLEDLQLQCGEVTQTLCWRLGIGSR